MMKKINVGNKFSVFTSLCVLAAECPGRLLYRCQVCVIYLALHDLLILCRKQAAACIILEDDHLYDLVSLLFLAHPYLKWLTRWRWVRQWCSHVKIWLFPSKVA